MLKWAVMAMCWVAVSGLELKSAEPVTQPTTREAKLTVLLVGDSTVTEKAGWGPGFTSSFGSDVCVVNKAAGGRSSKSYRDEGLWAKAMEVKADYVLIQFGHNDQPGKGPERETDPNSTFQENLVRYCSEARVHGMKPILLTSLTRRRWDANGKITSDLTAYAAGTMAAGETAKVPVIDLHQLSIEACNKLGEKGCEAISPRSVEGKIDTTHLNAEGAKVIGPIVARAFIELVPESAQYKKE